MTHLSKDMSPSDHYKLLCVELLFLIKQMKENPKSYTLWFHW